MDWAVSMIHVISYLGQSFALTQILLHILNAYFDLFGALWMWKFKLVKTSQVREIDEQSLLIWYQKAVNGSGPIHRVIAKKNTWFSFLPQADLRMQAVVILKTHNYFSKSFVFHPVRLYGLWTRNVDGVMQVNDYCQKFQY